MGGEIYQNIEFTPPPPRPGTFHFEIPVFKNEVRNTVGIGASLVHGN